MRLDMMRTSDLDYDLPDHLIAVRPVEPRDACRLMVVSRTDRSRIEHLTFRDLPSVLGRGDVVVTNTTRVVPARIRGTRADTGAKVEGLFLAESSAGMWSVLLKANTRLREGHRVVLHGPDGEPSGIHLDLIGRDGDGWAVRADSEPGGLGSGETASTILERVGSTPVPPYILGARRDAGDRTPDALDRAWYQTVYADRDRSGSVAAPTAGLHFTPELLGKLDAMGVARTGVTLDVGMGTFKPIEVERVEDHPIHAEKFSVPARAIEAMERARAAGGRVVAVGTTSVRAIETVPSPAPDGIQREGMSGSTSVFIQPGYRFGWTDALITNFHLPRSTLLAMVGAFLDGGVDRVLEVYRIAIDRGYRFYSYGDAMVILP